MKHPILRIEKIADAENIHGGIGGDSYRIPAQYRATGPSGRTYKIEGDPYGRMQRPRWYCDGKGAFPTMEACLNATAKQELATP